MAAAKKRFETVERVVKEEKQVGVTLELTEEEATILKALFGYNSTNPKAIFKLGNTSDLPKDVDEEDVSNAFGNIYQALRDA